MLAHGLLSKTGSSQHPPPAALAPPCRWWTIAPIDLHVLRPLSIDIEQAPRRRRARSSPAALRARAGDQIFIFFGCVACSVPGCVGHAYVVRVLATHKQGGAVVQLHDDGSGFQDQQVFRVQDNEMLIALRGPRWTGDESDDDDEDSEEATDEDPSESDEDSDTD